MTECPQGSEAQAVSEALEEARPSIRENEALTQDRAHWVSSRMGATPATRISKLPEPEGTADAPSLTPLLDEEIADPERAIALALMATSLEAQESHREPQPAERHDITSVRTGTHWVSTRMSSTLGPRVAEPEAPAEAPLISSAITQDIIDRIEILHRDLMSAKNALIPVQSAAMPLILHEPLQTSPESALVPTPESVQPLPSLASTQNVDDWRPAQARSPLSVTFGCTTIAVGAVVLVAGLWHFGDETTSRISPAAALPAVVESAPQLPPTFAQADATGSETAEPNDIQAANASEPAIAELMTEIEIHPVENAAAGLVLATEPSPVEENPPHAMHDPVESVVVKGLPPGVMLSAGYRLSEDDWEIPPEHASNVGLVVPGDRTEPVRAGIEFKSRDGFVVTRLGLHVAHEPPPVPSVAVEAPVQVESLQEIGRAAEAAPIPMQQVETVPPEEEVRVFEQKPARVPPPKQKARASQIKAVPPMNLGVAKPAPTPAPKTAAVPKMTPGAKKAPAPPPRGLFQIGPDGITVSSASPAPPVAATTAVTTKPAAAERDRAPGFETLETLGGGFALDEP